MTNAELIQKVAELEGKMSNTQDSLGFLFVFCLALMLNKLFDLKPWLVDGKIENPNILLLGLAIILFAIHYLGGVYFA